MESSGKFMEIKSSPNHVRFVKLKLNPVSLFSKRIDDAAVEDTPVILTSLTTAPVGRPGIVLPSK